MNGSPAAPSLSRELLTLWVRNQAWNDGAWTNTEMHSTDPVFFNEACLTTSPGQGRFWVLGGMRVQHLVVVPAGVTPEPNWIGLDCHVAGEVDAEGCCNHFVFEDPGRPGRARWDHQNYSVRPPTRQPDLRRSLCDRVLEVPIGAAAQAVSLSASPARLALV